MSFKQAFEKHLNKELEEDHKDPPPSIDIEIQQDPPPVHIFPSYPSYPPQPQLQPQQRSGMYVPTPLFILLMLVLLFESSVLFVYTIIGLYNAVPSFPINAPHPPPACNCPAPAVQFPAVNVAPNFLLGSAAAAEQITVTETRDQGTTITVTATPSTGPSSSSRSSTSSETSSSTNSGSSPSSSLPAALLSLLPGLHTTNGIVTVTKPIPTITVLSTESQPLPSITTMTVLSTATPPPASPRSTVTQTTVITSGA